MNIRSRLPPRNRGPFPILLLGLLPAALAAQQATTASSSTPVKLGGYLQARLAFQRGVGMTATLNRARLNATGTIAGGFSYRIQGEFRTGNAGTGRASVSLTDAYIRWARQGFGLQVGQFKTPFTREYLASLPDLESLDRSAVVDALAPKRDIGIMADYRVGTHLSLAAGAFNGEGQNVAANTDSTLLGVARVVLRPAPEITLGANLARYFGDSTRYGGDLSFENARLVVRGEYVAQARDSLAGGDDSGWLGLAGYRVVPVVQLVAKYEDFRRPAIGPQQRNRAWSAGVNWYAVGSLVRLSAFYVSRNLGDPGVRTSVLQTQLQVRF
jgi:phosphate-selective porin